MKNTLFPEKFLKRRGLKLQQENKAIYQDKSVVVDGKIITADGPQASEDFAKAVIGALSL